MRPGPDAGAGCFVAWFVFCAALGVAWVGALIWLVVAVIGWLGRH